VLLGEILSYSEINEWDCDPVTEITGITYDSRKVFPGAAFVAIKGFKTDGHLYIEDAFVRGAAVVVVEDKRFISKGRPWIKVPDSRRALADFSAPIYGFPGDKLNIIGVTGTNGKTTTTNLITSILEEYDHRPGLIGTIHNRIGKEIIPVEHTTPEASDLQSLLAYFVDKAADYAVMEVSSHALELHRVNGTEYDVAVFTNLTQDHLDFHENMDKYLAAKGKLFSNLGVKSKKTRHKFAIINADDQSSDSLKDISSVPVITYGINKQADIMAKDVRISADGAKFKLEYINQSLPVSLKITGIFNVYNVLAATAVGLVEGVPIKNIITSLGKIDGVPGRFEKVSAGQDYTVIVDYSHTPDSLENCLKTAREFAESRIITVFGCGGDRDSKKRPLMGEVAGRLSDYIIVTSDNPRSEDPHKIIEDILPGLKHSASNSTYTVIADRKEAINRAVEMAGTRDVVIIAGKGHETYQIIGSKVLDFDDREVALAAIENRMKYEK